MAGVALNKVSQAVVAVGPLLREVLRESHVKSVRCGYIASFCWLPQSRVAGMTSYAYSFFRLNAPILRIL